MLKILLKIGLALLTFAAILAVALFVYTRADTPPDTQVFINAQVLTVDKQNTIAEAVAVKNDMIVAVGSNKEIQAFIDDDTVVHDLAGKSLVPGFIDAHGHFPGSGFSELSAQLASPPVGSVTNFAELKAKVQVFVDKTAPGEWVVGMGYDDTLLAEKQHPTRELLDSISTEHPIYIVHVSGHMGVGNTKAFNMMGITRDTPDPLGGHFIKDKDGELLGLVEETAHMPFVGKLFDLSAMQFKGMLDSAIQEYASLGVTTAQNGGASKAVYDTMKLAESINYIPFRMVVFPSGQGQKDMLLANNEKFNSDINDRFKGNIVKIIADGSIQGFTGYLSHPYHTPFRGDEEYNGYPSIIKDELTKQVVAFHKAGYQMAIHGNGDGSIDDILYAFEQAQKEYYVADPRLILIHAQMARDDQLLKMKKLGITPSFFSAHTYYWGDRHRDIFMGPERAMRMSPAKSALDIDLPFSIHLDTPVVPMNPIFLMWTAVNRMSTSGAVIGAEQRIGVMQALRATTIDAAYQVFKEKEVGSIEVGKYADLVILDDTLLDVAPYDIKDVKVDQTFVGGVSIFQRNSH
jgi:predicted amidohydrolase YtcJ